MLAELQYKVSAFKVNDLFNFQQVFLNKNHLLDIDCFNIWNIYFLVYGIKVTENIC